MQHITIIRHQYQWYHRLSLMIQTISSRKIQKSNAWCHTSRLAHWCPLLSLLHSIHFRQGTHLMWHQLGPGIYFANTNTASSTARNKTMSSGATTHYCWGHRWQGLHHCAAPALRVWHHAHSCGLSKPAGMPHCHRWQHCCQAASQVGMEDCHDHWSLLPTKVGDLCKWPNCHHPASSKYNCQRWEIDPDTVLFHHQRVWATHSSSVAWLLLAVSPPPVSITLSVM